MPRLSLNLTAAQYARVWTAARDAGLSMANYARVSIGLPVAKPGGPQPGSGRPKRKKTLT